MVNGGDSFAFLIFKISFHMIFIYFILIHLVSISWDSITGSYVIEKNPSWLEEPELAHPQGSSEEQKQREELNLEAMLITLLPLRLFGCQAVEWWPLCQHGR